MKPNNRSRRLFLMVAVVAFFSSCGGDSSAPAVTINLSGAQALFTVQKASSSPALDLAAVTSEEALGQLRKILADGTVQAVIYEDGEGKRQAAPIKPEMVFVGRDEKIYILFERIGVRIGEKQCYLVRGPISGPLECLGVQDGFRRLELDSFRNPVESWDATNRKYVETHFDSTNNFYYLEKIHGSDPFYIFKVLSPKGIVTDKLVVREAAISDYAVRPDGTLFFSGTTGATGTSFVRKTTPTGGISNVESLPSAGASGFFVSNSGDLFIIASLEKSEELRRYTSTSSWSLYEPVKPVVDEGSSSKISVLATEAGRIMNYLEDAANNVYTLVGDRLFRIYPGASVAITPSKNKIIIARTQGNLLYYLGTYEGKNIFLRVDLTDKTFSGTDLLNGKGADIEVHRFKVRSNGNILFGGLRLSDNQLILGEIAGKTLSMTVKATTTTRIDDLVLVVE